MPSIVVNGLTYELPPDDFQATKVPQYNSAISALAGAVLPVTGSAVLGSAYTLTDSYANTGLALNLPSKGIYLITADVRVDLQGNAGTSWYAKAKLRNSSDSADVANSERLLIFLNGTTRMQLTVPLTIPVTVSAAKTIQLHAIRVTGGSFTVSVIASDSDGRSSMSYVKIGES